MAYDEAAVVRRSTIAPCVTCGLCGSILRDATTVSECLHSFCRKCISEKFEEEDNKHCPTCNADLGWDPKLRADHSLQFITSVIFPAERRKIDEISSLHPESVSLPVLSSRANGACHSVKKVDACLVGVSMDADTLSSEVEIAAEGRTALPHVASRCEAQKNTARMLDKVEVYIGRSQALEADNARLREGDHNLPHVRSTTFPDVCLVGKPMDSETEGEACERLGMEPSASPAAPRQSQVTTTAPIPDQISMDIQTNPLSPVPSSTTVVTTNGPSDILTSVQYDETLRSQVLRICNENSERIMQRFDAYINQNQVYKEVARLKEELENARSEKTAAFERAKILEERLEEQTEQLQTESKKSQESEAARREVLREYRALKYEMTEKNEELSNLKHNIKRRIEVEQRNAVLEDQISHANSLFEAEKLNARKLNEQLGEVINEKNKLMTELEIYNDGLARIQECIRRSLTSRISRLKGISTTIKPGHFQHLLDRIDALGQVQEHLPKMLETIEIATSLSAYSPAAAMLIRLRAYHGDDFDLQRLILPLHLSEQDYARIRNAIDPLAANVAQRYRVFKH